MNFENLTEEELKIELQAIHVALRNVKLPNDEREQLIQEAEAIEELLAESENKLTFGD